MWRYVSALVPCLSQPHPAWPSELPGICRFQITVAIEFCTAAGDWGERAVLILWKGSRSDLQNADFVWNVCFCIKPTGAKRPLIHRWRLFPHLIEQSIFPQTGSVSLLPNFTVPISYVQAGNWQTNQTETLGWAETVNCVIMSDVRTVYLSFTAAVLKC